MTTERTALVISYSMIDNDPRVRRQIDWLDQDGWHVDTLGLGPHPSPVVDRHYEIAPLRGWAATRIGALLMYGLLPGRLQFQRVMANRFPAEVGARIRGGHYDLIVFDEYEVLPWLDDRRAFGESARHPRIHLDLHEYREAQRESTTRWQRLTERYYRWNHAFIAHPRITSRSTVASRIAELYAADLGIAPPVVVRNSPPYEDLAPQKVDPSRIRIIFHGLASRGRGFRQILDALRKLDGRFSVTFMLMQNGTVIPELASWIEAEGLSDRARIVPPVRMTELAKEVNQYDLEILFYPPIATNIEFALPNKLFEAIQGRLGIVIGESPMMREIVEAEGNGIVVHGWTGDDLAAALSALTAEDVWRFKKASAEAARRWNAEAEGRVFVATATGRSS